MTWLRQQARRRVFRELDRLIGQRHTTETKVRSSDVASQAKIHKT
jgi:hypothetical protein